MKLQLPLTRRLSPVLRQLSLKPAHTFAEAFGDLVLIEVFALGGADHRVGNLEE
jgi:hypothetical protein